MLQGMVSESGPLGLRCEKYPDVYEVRWDRRVWTAATNGSAMALYRGGHPSAVRDEKAEVLEAYMAKSAPTEWVRVSAAFGERVLQTALEWNQDHDGVVRVEVGGYCFDARLLARAVGVFRGGCRMRSLRRVVAVREGPNGEPRYGGELWLSGTHPREAVAVIRGMRDPAEDGDPRIPL